MFSKLENQFTLQRQRLAQTERDRSNLQELLDDETKHRANLVSKLQQSEVRFSIKSNFSFTKKNRFSSAWTRIINIVVFGCTTWKTRKKSSSSSLDGNFVSFFSKDFSQKLKELQYERDSLAQENARYRSLQTDYQDVQVGFFLLLINLLKSSTFFVFLLAKIRINKKRIHSRNESVANGLWKENRNSTSDSIDCLTCLCCLWLYCFSLNSMKKKVNIHVYKSKIANWKTSSNGWMKN